MKIVMFDSAFFFSKIRLVWVLEYFIKFDLIFFSNFFFQQT